MSLEGAIAGSNPFRCPDCSQTAVSAPRSPWPTRAEAPSGLVPARHPPGEELHLLRAPGLLPAARGRHLADGDAFVDVAGVGVIVLGIAHVGMVAQVDLQTV